MNYLTGKQLSEKWGIGQCRIVRLAREGRIKGAEKYGKTWFFPENVEKPPDGRTKAAKAEVKEDYFRFPLYVNGAAESFIPALSDEEKALRQAELDFLACDFPEAEKSLKKLSEKAKSIYVRIMSIFWLCWLSAGIHNGENYNGYFMKFEQELAKDFPRKRETELLRPWLYLNLTQYEKTADCLDFDINYNYSPDVLTLMLYLLCADKSRIEHPESFALRADFYEIEVRRLINSECFFEAQLLHLVLFVFYFMAAKEARMTYHLKSAVAIAYKHNFIYSVADAYPYYKSAFNRVLNSYPRAFADKLKQCGLKIGESFSVISKNHYISNVFHLLSTDDMKFVLYAAQGYSHKRVAEIVHVSPRTVANRYAEIYNKIGVDGKQGLLEAIKDGPVKKEEKKT